MNDTRPQLTTQIGLFLITLSVMGIELLEMRLLSFMLWHHLAYMVISIALMGLGAGGGLLAIQSQRILPNWAWWLSGSAMVGGLATVSAVSILSRFELDTFELTPGQLVVLIFHYALMSVTYIAAGLSVSIIFTRSIKYINKLYFIDLVGAGVGAVLTYVIIQPLGAPFALALMSTILASSAVLFAYEAKDKGLTLSSLVIITILAFSMMLSNEMMDIAPAGTKALAAGLDTKQNARIVSTQWTPLARIDLLEADESTHPFLTDIPGENVKMISIDGDAQTFMFRRPDVRGGLPEPDVSTISNYEFAFLLKESPEVLIIGPGGGNEVFAAHQWGASKVVGVELHKAILEVSEKQHVEFAGYIYESPIAEAVVADGRSYLERSDETFDIIQMSGVDTWSGLSSGAYVLSENYLYTVDAFVNYLQHLKADGILSVMRFKLDPPRESLRLISLALPALGHMRVENPSDHIVVLTTNPDLITVLIKRSPFDSSEMKILDDAIQLADGEIYYGPEITNDNPYSDLLEAFENGTVAGFLENYPYDMSPVTDDRPFFFEYYKWSNMIPDLNTAGEGGQIGANRPVALLVLSGLFLSVTVLSIVLILVPLILFRRRGLRVRWSRNIVGYFAFVGLAFMFIEIGMMQRFVLFLGHPGYSIPVVLTALLMSAGVGSLWSGRLTMTDRARMSTCLIGIPVTLLVLVMTMPIIFDVLLGFPLIVRVGATVGLLTIPGVLMGMPFPLGLSVVSQFGDSIIPWVYGVNAVASVLGTILVILVAMKLGFTVAIVLASVLYLAALILLLPLLARSSTSLSLNRGDM